MIIKNANEKSIDILIYIVMTIIGIITIYPFINVLALSFNDSSDAVAGGIYLWPRVFTLRNYQEVFSYPRLVRAFFNSVLRTLMGAGLGVFFTTMLAYTISRKDFIARKFVTVMFTLTMYVSGGMIPGYLLIKELHLFNNFMVYILPGMIWAFCVFVLRTYIDGLPYSLQESAMLDGANDAYIFIKIIFPLCMPSIATIALFYSVGHWNSWFDTYLFCSSNPDLSTLQFELQKIIRNAQAAAANMTGNDFNAEVMKSRNRITPKAIQMAITVVVTVPIIVVYPFLQKYFVKGMTLGAVKS